MASTPWELWAIAASLAWGKSTLALRVCTPGTHSIIHPVLLFLLFPPTSGSLHGGFLPKSSPSSLTLSTPIIFQTLFQLSLSQKSSLNLLTMPNLPITEFCSISQLFFRAFLALLHVVFKFYSKYVSSHWTISSIMVETLLFTFTVWFLYQKWCQAYNTHLMEKFWMNGWVQLVAGRVEIRVTQKMAWEKGAWKHW